MQVNARDAAAHARRLGYQVLEAEQLRSTRCLLVLTEPGREPFAVMAQRRHLITAADVQDFAEMLFLRRLAHGLLIAVEGSFSKEAQRTASELRHATITLATELPAASAALNPSLRPITDAN